MVACTDDIDKSNRFTFTGETVADYLMNRSDRYSHITTLFERAGLFSLLNTYGQFTLFLPDNEAVEKYVAEQDSIYWATKDTPDFINTGISSPLVEDLSDSIVNIIARTHIVESAISMADMGEGALPDRNFNYRFLGVNYVVKGENYYIMLNNSAAIIDGDNQVENGVIHHVDKVVAPSQKNVPELIGACQFFKIFAAALNRTGFCDSLKMDADDSYDPDNYTAVDLFGFHYSSPKTRFYKYTGFIEPDDVFRSNGIENIDDLVAFAEKWYGTEDRDNPKSPRNALYKFVAYHFVPRELSHNKIVPYGFSTQYWNIDVSMPTIYDRYDYFETMQGTLMKVVKPLSRPEGRDTYINFNKRELPYNIELRHHLNVRVIPLTEFIAMKEEYSSFNQMATNGIVHPIDKILIYNEDEMYGNILNERLRIDMYSLVPELSCNALRYKFLAETSREAIPPGYSEKVKINSGILRFGEEPRLYNCDRFILDGMFDVEFTLPPLPPRVYEVRVGYCCFGWYTGGVTNYGVQMYIDGKVEGRPYNINFKDPQPGIQTGFVADEYTYDNGMENDKNMRLLGWMKGPKSIHFCDKSARDSPYYIRRIIARKYFDAGRHTIRFRYVHPKDIESMDVDYLEFVPLHIISDPTKPEDRY